MGILLPMLCLETKKFSDPLSKKGTFHRSTNAKLASLTDAKQINSTPGFDFGAGSAIIISIIDLQHPAAQSKPSRKESHNTALMQVYQRPPAAKIISSIVSCGQKELCENTS